MCGVCLRAAENSGVGCGLRRLGIERSGHSARPHRWARFSRARLRARGSLCECLPRFAVRVLERAFVRLARALEQESAQGALHATAAFNVTAPKLEAALPGRRAARRNVAQSARRVTFRRSRCERGLPLAGGGNRSFHGTDPDDASSALELQERKERGQAHHRQVTPQRVALELQLALVRLLNGAHHW